MLFSFTTLGVGRSLSGANRIKPREKMVKDDGRLTLKNFVGNKRELVTLFIISIGSRLDDDVVNELLDTLVVEA